MKPESPVVSAIVSARALNARRELGLPIVNHDNSQHAPDENLRLQNLWDGIATFAVVAAGLGEAGS